MLCDYLIVVLNSLIKQLRVPGLLRSQDVTIAQ